MNSEVLSRKPVESAFAKIKSIIAKSGINRDSLNLAKQELETIARVSALWNPETYPNPEDPSKGSFYLVHKDQDTGYSLYLNVMAPGETTSVHNHTTWACIASVEGEETNYLFQRTDDGSVPGRSTVVAKGTWPVVPGNPIGILPDDIHSVANLSSGRVRHLHFYGTDVKDLTQRLRFDVEAGTHSVMPIVTVDNDR